MATSRQCQTWNCGLGATALSLGNHHWNNSLAKTGAAHVGWSAPGPPQESAPTSFSPRLLSHPPSGKTSGFLHCICGLLQGHQFLHKIAKSAGSVPTAWLSELCGDFLWCSHGNWPTIPLVSKEQWPHGQQCSTSIGTTSGQPWMQEERSHEYCIVWVKVSK